MHNKTTAISAQGSSQTSPFCGDGHCNLTWC